MSFLRAGLMLTSCLLEEGESLLCGDIVQFLCFGFAKTFASIINFCLFNLVDHTWVFVQMFVKSHIGQLFYIPFDVTMSVSVTIMMDNMELGLT